MHKITSAYANKMLRSLEEDKAFWVNKESTSSTYVAAVNEEPVVPEYDYMTVANTIDEIDRNQAHIESEQCDRKRAGRRSGNEH